MNKIDIKKAEKIEKIRQIIEKMWDLIEFKYDGRYGNIDEYYYPEEKKRKYLLFFEGYAVLVESVDEVLYTPFIDGKSLSEVVKEIKMYNGQERIY